MNKEFEVEELELNENEEYPKVLVYKSIPLGDNFRLDIHKIQKENKSKVFLRLFNIVMGHYTEQIILNLNETKQLIEVLKEVIQE
ncbi:MAG: hypothetical protein QXP36_04200 [Conexivisphaerales archaeon]|uniref:hypothetical protein n=1 Tax=Saccharolobus sp. TaxID=2100761 RepID=UPI003174DBCF